MHSFGGGSITAQYADGNMPNGGLVEGPDGYLYGSTMAGGLGNGTGAGIIFRISKTGTFQNLHSFCAGSTCTEGLTPSPLVLGLDGKFYGTTLTSFESGVKGTIFRISASGVLETLHKFAGIPDGSAPLGGLIQGSDCNFLRSRFRRRSDCQQFRHGVPHWPVLGVPQGELVASPS